MGEKMIIGYETAKGFFCPECFHRKKFSERLEMLQNFHFKTTDDRPYPLCEEIEVCGDCGQEFSTRARTVTK